MATVFRKPVYIPFVGRDVEDLLLWRNPRNSAILFGLATLAYVGLAYFDVVSFFSLFGYVLSIAATATFLWAQIGNFVSRSGPPVPTILTKGVTEEEARQYAVSMLPAVNRVLGTLGVIVSGKDLRLSSLVIGGSYAAARVFSVISPLTLSYLVVLLAFTLPKAYESKQDDVDKVAREVRLRLKEAYDKVNDAVLSKIPKAGQPHPQPKKVQ